MWLEKEACTTLSEEVLPANVDFKQFIEDFHRMHGYIDPSQSEVYYESEYVTIHYNRGHFSLQLKPHNNYERVKVSYIPSDRNVVTMKGIEMRELEPTNFRSFLFDWLYCRKYFDADNKSDILELGIKYYFKKEGGISRDTIIHQNGNTYSIPLYDASSGMQSAVPLVITTQFFTGKYFEVYDKEVSFEDTQKRGSLASKLVAHYFPAKSGKDSLEQYLEATRRTSGNRNDDERRRTELVGRDFIRLSSPHSIAFIIEEPEQNLFPQTQLDLVNDIISCCNRETHLSTALITTHSPYVLSAINILMFAGQMIKKGMKKSDIAKFIPLNSIIMPEDVEVYSVQDGNCRSIKDAASGLIDQNDLDSASEYNSGVFDNLYKLYVSHIQSV